MTAVTRGGELPVVGLGAASSGPDWRSIRDVLSVARFASALVSRHQSPLVERLRRDSPYTSRRVNATVVDPIILPIKPRGADYFAHFSSQTP